MLQVLTFIGVTALVSLEFLKLALAFREAHNQRKMREALERALDGEPGTEIKATKKVIDKKANK